MVIAQWMFGFDCCMQIQQEVGEQPNRFADGTRNDVGKTQGFG
jgi:hypothetical protein